VRTCFIFRRSGDSEAGGRLYSFPPFPPSAVGRQDVFLTSVWSRPYLFRWAHEILDMFDVSFLLRHQFDLLSAGAVMGRRSSPYSLAPIGSSCFPCFFSLFCVFERRAFIG